MGMKPEIETALIELLRWPQGKNLNDMKVALGENNITPWGSSLLYPEFVTISFDVRKKLDLDKKMKKLGTAGFFVKEVKKENPQTQGNGRMGHHRRKHHKSDGLIHSFFAGDQRKNMKDKI